MVAISVVVFLVASLLVATQNERRRQAEIGQSARAQAAVLAEIVPAALSFNDHQALQSYVDALEANAEVDAVGIYDERGRLAASYVRGHLAPQLSAALTPAQSPNQTIVTAPVAQRGRSCSVWSSAASRRSISSIARCRAQRS